MDSTPKSMRTQLGIFGRTNVGKSSLLNLIAGQDIAVTSTVPGTTTDVVEKAMELLPIGPVVFLDTAGLDDTSALAPARLAKTQKIFDRADVFILVVEPGVWTSFEDSVIGEARSRQAPCLIAVNKTDLQRPDDAYLSRLRLQSPFVCECSSRNGARREQHLADFKRELGSALREAAGPNLPLLGDLVPAGGCVVLIVPIDLQAPKGRLILPQVQTIRDALDNDASVFVVKEREYARLLGRLAVPPNLVVCDSQVVLKMVADTPRSIPCTTFSILFARLKGDLREAARGAAALDRLGPGDKVLIGEACSHHALEDDIGRVKIPRWLRQYTGSDLVVDVACGRDYPANLAEYKILIHCGACMLTRREMLARIARAREAGVAVTNYGLAIALVQGVIRRVLSPFPAALDALEAEAARHNVRQITDANPTG